MTHCINISHPTIQEYSALTGIDPMLIAAKVGVWQNKNNTDIIPSLEDLKIPITKNISSFIKPGVQEVFDSNPELSRVGDVFSYAIYLDTIFPDSQVKDIVYHGSNNEFDKFDDLKQGSLDEGLYGLAHYFSSSKDYAKDYAEIIDEDLIHKGIIKKIEDGYLYSVLLNIKNPYIENKLENSINLKSSNYDAAMDEHKIEIAVKTSEQIHILASKQDIEGFRKFINKGDMLNIPSNIEDVREVSNDTLNKLRVFLSNSGISLSLVENITLNGKKVDANGIARIYKGVIEIVQGKEAEVLPEETFHFVTSYLREYNPDLYQVLASKVTQHPIYKETLNSYRDNPLYQIHTFSPSTGEEIITVDFDKIKEEAIGKLLASVLKDRDNRKPGISNFIKEAWGTIKNIIASIFATRKSQSVDLSSYERVIDMVLSGEPVKSMQDYITSLPQVSDRDFLHLKTDSNDSQRVKFNDTNELQDQFTKLIVDQASNYQLIEMPNPEDSHYVNNKSQTKLDRMTRAIYDIFSPDIIKNLFLNRKIGTTDAYREWYKKSEGRSTDQGAIEYKGNMVTFDQLVDIKSEEIKEYSRRGTILHKLVERYLNKAQGNTLRVNELNKEISTLKEELSTVNKVRIEEWFTEDVINQILTRDLRLTLNEDPTNKSKGLKDNVLSEIYVANDELGLATTADLLVVRPNGNVLVADLKTGDKFFDNFIDGSLMKYALKADSNFMDNRENKAFLQLAMTVFMLKLNNPTLNFDIPKIIHVSRTTAITNRPTIKSAPLDSSLKMIEEWIKNEKPELYEKYKNMTHEDGTKVNLFNISSYVGVDSSIYNLQRKASDLEGYTDSYATMLTKLLEELNNKVLKSTLSGYNPTRYEQDEISNLTRDIEALMLENGESLSEVNKDVSYLSRWIRDPYSSRKSPYINLLMKIYDRGVDRYNKQVIDIQNTQWKLVQALQKDKPGAKDSFGAWRFYVGDGTGLYDFMIEHNRYNDLEGYYIKRLIEADVKSGKITQNQWNYYRFFQETKKNVWDKAMKQKINFGNGRSETKEEIYGRGEPGEYFMPRLMPGTTELYQRFKNQKILTGKGKSGTEKVIESIKKNFNDMFAADRIDPRNGRQFGVPVKWMGSKRIIESGEHTFNMEAALLAWSKNMTEKAEIDSVHSFGEALKIELEKVGRTKGLSTKNDYKNTIGYIDSMLKIVIGDREDEIFLESLGFNIAGKRYSGARLAQGVSKATGASSMWFNKVSGFFNTILQGMLSFKEATSASITQRLGGGLDASAGDSLYAKAYNIYLKYKVAKIDIPYAWDGDRTKLLHNKVFRMAQHMRFDTKASMSHISDRELQGNRYRNLSQDSLYLLQAIGEDSSLYTTMIASLLKLKIRDGFGNYYKKDGSKWIKLGSSKEDEKNASSMWDAYEVDSEGNFDYTGPVRGINKLGEKITGLTTEEITRAKRLSQKAYGSYRDTERVPLEGSVLGSWAMKFKKYLPQVIMNALDKRYEDVTLGQWKRTWENETTKIDSDTGLPIMEWEKMINEGMYRVLGNTIMAIFANTTGWRSEHFDKWRWENLSPLQKQQLISSLLSVATTLAFVGMGAAFFDDEDKNTVFYSRYVRLTQDQFGIYPPDMLNTIKTPFAQAVWAFGEMTAMKKFFFDSMIMGERVKTGPNAGDYLGWSVLRRKTPGLNIITQFGFFNEDKPDKSDNWFINTMSYR